MKKIFLVVALGFVSLFAAGCSANKSASAVAQNLVERISNGNYSKIEKIIYLEDDALFSEDNLKDLIEKYELNIKGNKTVEVVEVSDATQDENGHNIVTVTVLIDGDKNLTIDTIEVDGKWYVYESVFYDTDINIVVPEGVTLEINGEKISKDKIEKITKGYKITHPGDESIFVELGDVDVDMYVLRKPLKGSYSITLKGTETISDVIVTSTKCGDISSENYNYECYENMPVFYDFKSTKLVANDDIKTFVKEYIVDVQNGIDEKKDFSNLKEYFSDEIAETAKNEYDLASYWLSHASYVEPLDSAYYSNYTLDSLNFIDIKTYDDNNIVVVANYGVRYLYNTKNPNGTVDSQSYYNTYKLLLTLRKEGNTYKITNGFNLFRSGE